MTSGHVQNPGVLEWDRRVGGRARRGRKRMARSNGSSNGVGRSSGNRQARDAAPAFDVRDLDEGAKADQEREITSLIESEVIPRLMMLHCERSLLGSSALLSDRRANSADVAALTNLVLSTDPDAAAAFIDRMLREGAQIDDILMNLLAPAARRLGDMWLSDEVDFLAVTSAVCGLQQLLHKLSPPVAAVVRENGLNALLLPTPGEQHSFGLLIVTEMFRKDGWVVTTDIKATPGAIDRMVANVPFALIGFSLSSEGLLDPLASAIDTVRRCSCFRSAKVLVGGRAFATEPKLAAAVGADFVANDVAEALAYAREIEAVAVKPL